PPPRSRPGRCRAPTASPSTTSCCASRRSSARCASRAGTPSPRGPDGLRDEGGVCYAVVLMKWLAAALALVLILLQYRIWVSDNGVRQVEHLRQAVAAQQAEDAQLAESNRQLAAEVRDLKTGMDALEERARSDLGMIARNETFYQVVPPRPADAPPPTRTAAR